MISSFILLSAILDPAYYDITEILRLSNSNAAHPQRSPSIDEKAPTSVVAVCAVYAPYTHKRIIHGVEKNRWYTLNFRNIKLVFSLNYKRPVVYGAERCYYHETGTRKPMIKWESTH